MEQSKPLLVVVSAGVKSDLESLSSALKLVDHDTGMIVREVPSSEYGFDPVAVHDLAWKLMTLLSTAAVKQLIDWAVAEVKARKSRKEQGESPAAIVIKIDKIVVELGSNDDPRLVRDMLEGAFQPK